jgi:hypothetical protein
MITETYSAPYLLHPARVFSLGTPFCNPMATFAVRATRFIVRRSNVNPRRSKVRSTVHRLRRPVQLPIDPDRGAFAFLSVQTLFPALTAP